MGESGKKWTKRKRANVTRIEKIHCCDVLALVSLIIPLFIQTGYKDILNCAFTATCMGAGKSRLL